MSEYILAHPSPYDVSISLTLFDNWEQVTHRAFSLRNLKGQTEQDQVKEATALMAAVAAELHYITGYGIDKGDVRVNGKKLNEVVYKNFTPHGSIPYFWYGVKVSFLGTRNYQWVEGGQHGWRISEERLREGWQRQIWEENIKAGFRIPCLFASQRQDRDEHFFYCVAFKKKRTKTTGWVCQYDKEDAVFSRFISRFNDEGNLAVGPERNWAKTTANIFIEGIKWPRSKAKPTKIPRKSKLASQPKDDTDYVYLIRMGRTNFHKIGKSNDPQDRLASMQTASPYKLKIIHLFKADNAAAAEETLHHHFHDFRQEGEWFKLTDTQQKTLTSITSYEDGHFIVAGKQLNLDELFGS